MHGRLKVKTTAEQEAEKQKERQKKLALYTEGTRKVTEKRNLREYDTEALAISGQLLQHNPDHYTIWNFRKEIIEAMTAEKSENVEEVKCLLENELYLTEACLRKNPKSYGAWFHRSWALKAIPNTNWKRELNMCGKLLQVDDRNFHCWNHRRAVCHLAKEKPEDELAFTLKKIDENFSNYSAWHYRSLLLPLVYPGKNAFGPAVDQDTLLKEYELVQNAAFTDPNDQSAWFYHRWLLGRADLDLCLLCCHFDCTHNKMTVVFNKAIKKHITGNLSILVKDKVVNSNWEAPEGESYNSKVWSCDVPPTSSEDSEIQITFENGSEMEQMKCSSSVNTVWNECHKNSLYSLELSAATSEVLHQELESCQQLLDMEPDNKWTLLTCVLLLRAVNSLLHEEKILKYLDKLVTVDHTRRNYYLDLRSKCVIENALTTFLTGSSSCLNLSKKSLTLFCHANHLVFLQTLDLSNNKLSSLHSLRSLVSLQELILDYNEVADCSGVQRLKHLQRLSLNHNRVSCFEQLEAIKSCDSLQSLRIANNPISSSSNFYNEVKLIFPLLHEVS